ncbi:YHS domain-containing (seleno)protein [Flavitalea antarctica]
MKQIAFIAISFFSLVGELSAQINSRQQAFNLSGNAIAIQGYDPVAYFIQGKAVEGKRTYSVLHEGITYQFSSQQNKEAFMAQPAKYEPQYGGWCAYAMGATGEKVDVDPETFKVVNGKLFLFYNKFFNNTLKSWNKDEKNLHSKADVNWSKLYKQKS